MTGPTTRPASVPPRSATRRSGFLLVILGAVLWGTGGVAGSVVAANSDMSWLAISALRLLGGGLIMIVVTLGTGELRRIPRTTASAKHILLTGVLIAVAGGTYFQALAFVGVAVATVLALGTSPLFVAVVTAVRGRRLPSRSVTAALILALVGLVLVCDVSPVAAGPDAWHTALGAALAVLSGLAFGATTMVNRRVVPGLSPRPLIATSFTVAGLISLVPGVAAGLGLTSMTAAAWLGLSFLAVVQTALGYLSFYLGLQRGVPATSAAVLTLIEPLAAAALAMVVLHEPLRIATAAGIALLLVAVVLVRPPRPRADAAEITAATSAEGLEPSAAAGCVNPAAAAAPAQP